MSNPATILKATGRLVGVPLSKLGSVSLRAEQITSVADNWMCLHPDAVDQEIVEADPTKLAAAFVSEYGPEECGWIQGMHRRMGEATGRGGWPPGKQCHPTIYPHDGYHATLVYCEVEEFYKNPSIRREVTDEEWQRTVVDARVWPTVENPVKTVAEAKATFVYGGEHVAAFDRPEWQLRSIGSKKNGDKFDMFHLSTWLVYEATRRAGVLFIEQFTGADGAHNIHEKMIAIPGSTAGFAYFPNGQCNDHVTSNIDSLLTYSLSRLTSLRTHEHGHNLKLEHEFKEPQSAHRSIMSYAADPVEFQGYRRAGQPYMYTEDHSWPELRSMYGGEAAKPIATVTPPPPPPPPPPPGSQIYVTGEVNVMQGTTKIAGPFIIVPK